MKKKILDALEIALIGLFLISSYFGFFFIASTCLILAGVQFTIPLIVLVFLCSCGFTHMLVRWIYRVNQKGIAIQWKEKHQKNKPVEDV